MPHDRPPLSADEKLFLKQWLDGGATWALETIDPAVYANGDRSQKVFVQRLTVPEFIETVRSTAGVNIAKEARELLPQDMRADRRLQHDPQRFRYLPPPRSREARRTPSGRDPRVIIILSKFAYSLVNTSPEIIP